MKRIITFSLIFVLFFTFIFSADAIDSDYEGLALETVTVQELKKALDYGIVSCEELTRYCLNRIEEYNQEYNCFILLVDDALEQAKQKDILLKEGKAEGALFGIPVVIKDNMHLAGYPTSNGYSSSYIPEESADVVQMLIDEGAVIIGKANMSTGAISSAHSYSDAIGNTGNAYNPLLSPGGSSGGSAVAVSLNFAFLALGTDTNSSLRIPAALNGCISMRSTFDLISTEGIVPLNELRDVAGPITDNVFDQAYALDVLTGFEYNYTDNLNSETLSGSRLGIITELTTGEYVDPQVIAAFENAVKELESLGAEVMEISFPNLVSDSITAFHTDDYYLKEELYSRYAELLEVNDLDAVIYPSIVSSPIKLGSYDYMESQLWENNLYMISPTTGCPEISVPIGLYSEGCGIGMEIAALKNEEQLLLDLAYSYTESFNHRVSPIEDSGESLERLIRRYEAAAVKREQEKVTATEAVTVLKDTGNETEKKPIGLEIMVGCILSAGFILICLVIRKRK